MNKIKKAPRGRPREFDTEHVLDVAMRLFWVKGYEGTSMSDLVTATGLSRASLYAAFGDKESLFLTVLARYGEKFTSRPISAFSEFDDPFDAVLHFLRRTAEHLTDARLPRGCLFANASAEGAGSSAAISRAVADGAARLETALYEAMHKGQSRGKLARDADVRALARFYAGVAQGMALMARLSTDPTFIQDIAATAMNAWPRTPHLHAV